MNTFQTIVPSSSADVFLIDSVKTEIVLQGYDAIDFLTLPHEKGSSRELLLALGWVLGNLNDLEDVSSTFADLDSETTEVDLGQKSLTDLDKLRRLQWELGKLNQTWRRLDNVDSYKLVQSHKVYEKTWGQGLVPSTPHLSVSEACLLADPKNLYPSLELLEKEVLFLQSLVLWKEKGRKIFWDWMESVIDAKMKSKDLHSRDPLLEISLPLNLLPILEFELKETVAEFHEILVKNEARIKEVISPKQYVATEMVCLLTSVSF
jgi:hypothetical protein